MAAKRTCPPCGAGLTDGVLEGLCPKCIGKFTFGLDSSREPIPRLTGPELPSTPAETEGHDCDRAGLGPQHREARRPHRALQAPPASGRGWPGQRVDVFDDSQLLQKRQDSFSV